MIFFVYLIIMITSCLLRIIRFFKQDYFSSFMNKLFIFKWNTISKLVTYLLVTVFFTVLIIVLIKILLLNAGVELKFES